MNPAEQKFSTSEGLLAFCLYLAGCEFSDPRTPCFNIYDPDTVFALGGGKKDQNGKVTTTSRFSGLKLWDAALMAWKEHGRGHVGWSFPLTGRTHELIKAYRDQREQMEKSDGKASDMVLEIMKSAAAGAMLPDEAVLRITCVIGKIRSEFMNLWKEVVPLLRVSETGKTKRFDSTISIPDGKGGQKTVPCKAVEKPGYKLISLNASEETKRKMGLA